MKKKTGHYALSHRLASNALLRRLTAPGELSARTLIMPFFVVEGKDVRQSVPSMPGVARLSVDRLVREVGKAGALGLGGVILFGVPSRKDPAASGAYAPDGIVQKAVRALKKKVKDIPVITDVCLCAYTSHGHCGVLRSPPGRPKASCRGFIDLPRTLELLSLTALSHAEAGADMVAPSAMMDRQVKMIRGSLDRKGFQKTAVMAYSAKFASAFYGPFRDAADSAPQFGDRRSYQVGPADTVRALAEAATDVKEGADIVMVKPALPYLDIVRRVRETVSLPVAAYNVSGEYAMVKAAAGKGWIDEKKVVLELLAGIRRAGAGVTLTYHACDAARWLKES
jgi:porphobilinogen synthase